MSTRQEIITLLAAQLNIYVALSGRDCATGVLRFLGTGGNYTTTIGTIVTS